MVYSFIILSIVFTLTNHGSGFKRWSSPLSNQELEYRCWFLYGICIYGQHGFSSIKSGVWLGPFVSNFINILNLLCILFKQYTHKCEQYANFIYERSLVNTQCLRNCTRCAELRRQNTVDLIEIFSRFSWNSRPPNGFKFCICTRIRYWMLYCTYSVLLLCYSICQMLTYRTIISTGSTQHVGIQFQNKTYVVHKWTFKHNDIRVQGYLK